MYRKWCRGPQQKQLSGSKGAHGALRSPWRVAERRRACRQTPGEDERDVHKGRSASLCYDWRLATSSAGGAASLNPLPLSPLTDEQREHLKEEADSALQVCVCFSLSASPQRGYFSRSEALKDYLRLQRVRESVCVYVCVCTRVCACARVCVCACLLFLCVFIQSKARRKKGKEERGRWPEQLWGSDDKYIFAKEKSY